MGRETSCIAHYQRQSSVGKLLHETDDLRFRGDFRLVIPLRQITQAIAKNGELHVQWPAGAARFELGAAATKWAEAITNPKSLLDKLGVKSGQVVSVVGVNDDALARKAAGLVDVKVARFSESHTALKFVIPVAKRG